MAQTPNTYDLIVIGGGSGGLACAKEAAQLGRSVALFDFVVPTPHGTKWGLGGTCVNVGCIPKKLMHQASLLGEAINDSAEYGWKVQKEAHIWEKMVEAIQDYIHSLNFGYRVQLRSNKVEYFNAYAKFVDPHTIECTKLNKEVVQLKADNFVIATGGRPRYPDFPGNEHCITSDDIFSLQTPPGKTLVIGASYVALECAGFLSSLNYDVTVMARSIFLRGFDQQMAEMIADYMQNHRTKFIRPAIPSSIEKLPSGKLKVNWTFEGAPHSDEFDTVLAAIGRNAETSNIALDKAGVVVDKATGKIDAKFEQTNVPHIYAIGDVLKGRQELTPVAIQAGRLLARRLFGNSQVQMDYVNVPTTIFTPLEYGCCGLTEEEAKAEFGEDKIEVYHSSFKPLEWTLPHREDNICYVKLICRDDTQAVIGFHILSPNAGEITQGFAVAMKAGATKTHFDMTVGIHPTIAEEFTTLSITKSSGKQATKAGC